MPRAITADLIIRDVPVLRTGDLIKDAVGRLLDCDLPALPVEDDKDRFAGVFGEREFMQALFPGYVGQLQSAGFVRRSMEDVLQKRGTCANETVGMHMHAEQHVAVGEDFSDMQVAEVFLHHRVLIVPVVRDRRVIGVVTRGDFFRKLAERFIGR